ncbi:hypothetical protein Tco_0229106, partial [Tanacetum coccineum]
MNHFAKTGVTKIVLLGFQRLASRFIDTRGCILNKSLLGIFHAALSVMGTTADIIRRSDFVHLDKLLRSEMSFYQALDLIFELDETMVRCTHDILRQRDCLDRLSEVAWVIPTFVVIEGE